MDELHLDGGVLLFTMVVSVAVAMAFGPALWVSWHSGIGSGVQIGVPPRAESTASER